MDEVDRNESIKKNEEVLPEDIFWEDDDPDQSSSTELSNGSSILTKHPNSPIIQQGYLECQVMKLKYI